MAASVAASHLHTVQSDVVEVVHVVERPQADLPFGKGLIDHSHVWGLHVVKVNFDSSLSTIAHDLHRVPLIVPRNKLFVFGERPARASLTIMI